MVQNSSSDPIADGWTTYSSIRWKERIAPFSGALDKVERLRTAYFDWKQTKQRDIGMIAEEVGMILPEVVSYEPNGRDAKSIDYGRLTAALYRQSRNSRSKSMS
ncbi:MAG: tail fiber domain-containing protein [Desulfomonile tiedjei]|nr:tail fiber domain-containing protein [Desulfomonile tiedjei]